MGAAVLHLRDDGGGLPRGVGGVGRAAGRAGLTGPVGAVRRHRVQRANRSSSNHRQPQTIHRQHGRGPALFRRLATVYCPRILSSVEKGETIAVPGGGQMIPVDHSRYQTMVYATYFVVDGKFSENHSARSVSSFTRAGKFSISRSSVCIRVRISSRV